MIRMEAYPFHEQGEVVEHRVVDCDCHKRGASDHVEGRGMVSLKEVEDTE